MMSTLMSPLGEKSENHGNQTAGQGQSVVGATYDFSTGKEK